MNKNIKTINKILISCLVCFFAIFAVVMVFNAGTNVALAETSIDQELECLTYNNETTPLGLYTHLTLNIYGGDWKVCASVKNDFTLFSSQVEVVIELYSSETYSSSYLNMTLEGVKRIEDLNMGKTATLEVSTGGFQKYWVARMCYKVDGNSWKSETTRCILYSSAGEYIG